MKQALTVEHPAQYDHIGGKYDEYAQTATLKRAESYTSDPRPVVPEDAARYRAAY